MYGKMCRWKNLLECVYDYMGRKGIGWKVCVCVCEEERCQHVEQFSIFCLLVCMCVCWGYECFVCKCMVWVVLLVCVGVCLHVVCVDAT